MLSKIDLNATLQAIPWFRELNPSQITQLAGIVEINKIESDHNLFLEGEQIDYIYIVLEGKIAIENYIPRRGNICVFIAEPLDIIGWASLTPVIRQREDSARTILPSTLLGIRGDSLRQLCDQDHELGYFIMRRVANIVASHMLNTRFHLLDIITCLQEQYGI